MTEVVIIEDEQPAYHNLKHFIEKADPNMRIVSWLRSVEQAVAYLKQNRQPDLLIVDIQLSDGYVFALFAEVKVECPVIFSTAFDQYALKAFELNSVDYLLKPLGFEQVKKALEKFHRYHQKIDITKLKSSFEQVKTERYKQRFLVKRGEELVSLPIDKIAWVYSDEASFCVTVEGRRFSLPGSLSQISEQLDPQHFFRLNRKVIVKHEAIAQVSRQLGGKLKVELNPQAEFKVVVSRDKAAMFKSWYQAD